MKSIDVAQLLELSIALSSQKDGDSLLEQILTAAMDITECDGGTLYIKDEDSLTFKLMITRSNGTLRGGRYGEITLPPVPINRANVCACAALDGNLINLPNVYASRRYDFSGPQQYDAMTGYQTVSMLVVPMENDQGNTIGVLQLINAQDGKGNTVPFPQDCERVIRAMASLAAISLTNMNYAQAVQDLLGSLVGVLSTAIDARTPYNANHTRSMARYAIHFMAWLDTAQRGWIFSPAEKQQFLLCVWLHDVGKLTTPLEVMDKNSRLGVEVDRVLDRLDKIRLLTRLRSLETGAPCGDILAAVEEGKRLVVQANTVGFLTDELLRAVEALGKRTYVEEDGTQTTWLRPTELTSLSVRQGTLTAAERAIMENHVVMTSRILAEVRFSGEYAQVAKWAGAHHEFLDGSGYPNHLQGDVLDRETRLLTILDVFDALTAQDRPYKPPMPLEQALEVLHTMAGNGQLDETVLKLFEESRAWERGVPVQTNEV